MIAIGLHERRRTVRCIAVGLALAVVASGLLGRQHASEVAHVRDPSSGDVVHAHELAERHEQGAAHHLHGTADHGHHGAPGVCALHAIAPGHAACAERVAIAGAPVVSDTLQLAPAGAARVERATYRIAPKTSPPQA